MIQQYSKIILLTILICSLFLAFISSSVLAIDNVITEIAPCINGFHYEAAKGWGLVYYINGPQIFAGQGWQCVYCYDFLVTDGNPTYY